MNPNGENRQNKNLSAYQQKLAESLSLQTWELIEALYIASQGTTYSIHLSFLAQKLRLSTREARHAARDLQEQGLVELREDLEHDGALCLKLSAAGIAIISRKR